jgi:hypothetical protein
MKTQQMKSLTLLALLVAFEPAFGITRYEYSGNGFSAFLIDPFPDDTVSPFDPYTTSNRLTGYFELGSALGANADVIITNDAATEVALLDLVFEDGRQTLSISDPTIQVLISISTDDTGAIDEWFLETRTRIQSPASGATEGILEITDFGDFTQSFVCVNEACSEFVTEQASNTAPGVWTVETSTEPPITPEVAVPVPAFAQGLLLAAVGLGGIARRRPRIGAH